MTNPVLVEAVRGGIVESCHRGAVVVVDGDGATLLEIGDVERPVFPRSAVKAIQALPLVESGAADAYGFGDREIALACASHSGEAGHVALARDMLARAGLDETALECGSQWPVSQDAARDLAGKGAKPGAIHNNCSGKHAGFLCTCRHAGIAHEGYVENGHAEQEIVRDALEQLTGVPHTAANRAVDGCAIPTYAAPLAGLARGFSRMVTGRGLSETRAKAASRIVNACMAEPFFVAGTDRADTKLMALAPGRIFVKTGAEGVYCGALPQQGIAVALKCDDGAGRASETAIAAVLARFLEKDEETAANLAPFVRPELFNWNGTQVGSLRPAGPLA